jgi:potassium-transporting ATPase KdpC subunit
MRALLRQLRPAVTVLAIFTIVCGVIYPLAVTAVGQTAFNHRANGSIVSFNGQAVGSSLIGQTFTAPGYFHARPSAAGTGYDGMASGGSNLGPNNPDLLKTVSDRVAAYRVENNLSDQVAVPVDAVTASASGLDPEISVANALLQASRVAQARGVDLAVVRDAIAAQTKHRPLGILGDPGVAVLALNIALDRMG